MKNKQIKRWPSLRGPPVQSPSNGLVKEHYTAKNSIPALYLDTHSPRLSTVPQKLTNSSPPPPPWKNSDAAATVLLLRHLPRITTICTSTKTTEIHTHIFLFPFPRRPVENKTHSPTTRSHRKKLNYFGLTKAISTAKLHLIS